MPGYDIERFPNITTTEKAELTCGICQDVFRCPLVANCCLQTFCEDCITDWLLTNNTCPYDRASLTVSQLTRAPRLVLNMLGKLKIKCEFRENGCKEVVSLETINEHQLSCVNNPENKICKTCFTANAKTGHNCVKSLLEINKKLNTDLDKFKRDYESLLQKMKTNNNSSLRTTQDFRYESLQRELRELKTEKENLLKTIQDISNAEPTHSLANITISEQNMISEARMHLSAPDIVQNETTNEIKCRIVALVRDELREHNSVFVICKNITDKLNEEYGQIWHCISSYDQHSNSCFHYESGFLVKLQYGKLLLKIYKTHYLDIKSMAQRFRCGKIKREISILSFDMSETLIADLKRFTYSALEKSETFNEMSSDIKTQMMSKHGGSWQCFIYAYFGSGSLQHTLGKYINYKIGELNITVYQTSD